MKKLAFTLLLITTSIHTWAKEAQINTQDTPKPATSAQEPQANGHEAHPSNQKARAMKLPNYGSLVIDCGFDLLREPPQAMKLNFWGSRFSNVYAYYNILLGQYNFAVSPGIGMGFERYQFTKQDEKYYTLVRNKDSRHTELKNASELFPNSKEILQSNLDLSYLDFVLELRFSTNSEYPKESFFVAIGFKLGMLWEASTTVEYKEDDQMKKRIDLESFNLNRMRCGAHARLGWGRFSLFYTQTLSNLFNENQGPDNTTTKPHSIGISVDLF